jgi:hypothetical protein
LPPSDLWTIKKIKNHKERIDRKEIKEAREILGIVNYPVWDFIQPENFMFPELHAEIGLVNNVLDKFYSFFDDQVEAITPEEATARNNLRGFIRKERLNFVLMKEKLGRRRKGMKVDQRHYNI